VQELNAKVLRATEQLTQALGREPMPEEIADHLGVPVQSVHNVLAARELNHVSSLSSPTDGAGESETSLLEKEHARPLDAESYSLPIEDRIVLDEAISKLKALEQKVVRHYFFDDQTQTEIARQLGISVNYASYLLRRAIAKIKTTLEEQAEVKSQGYESESLSLPADIPTFDTFTGVHSGMYLHLRVKEEIARSQRYPTNFTLMLIHVKDREDDRVLLTGIGRWLRDSTRVVDLIGYLGDGTFGLLLPHTGREARVLGERLCQTASRRDRAPFADQPQLVEITIGYAVFPMDGAMADVLVKRAHLALDTAIVRGPFSAQGAATRPATPAR